MRLWRRWYIVNRRDDSRVAGPFPTRLHVWSHVVTLALASVWSHDYKIVREGRF